jgi:capping protein beta
MADTDRYFEGGISSVYLWDMDDGFAGCVLLKKGMQYFPCPTVTC